MLDDYANFRRLSPGGGSAVSKGMIRRLYEARARTVRDPVRRLGPTLRSMAENGGNLACSISSRVLVIARRWANNYAVWHKCRQAIRELAALDDRALKDFGIHRSEIETVVYGRDSKQMVESKVAAVLLHTPNDRGFATNQMIEKDAA